MNTEATKTAALRQVGRISYNGRAWDLNDKEISL